MLIGSPVGGIPLHGHAKSRSRLGRLQLSNVKLADARKTASSQAGLTSCVL